MKIRCKIFFPFGLLALFLLAISARSQSDTVFLNKSWFKCKRHKASYYRLIFPQESGYLVKDFYMNGKPEMVAECSSVRISNFMKDGKCAYYNKRGFKTTEGTFKSGTEYGVWKWWTHNGKDSTVVNYTPDSLLYAGWKPQNQSSFIIANVNYRAKVNRSPLSSGKGIGIELGLNLGYFISQRLLIAPFVGWSMKDILWNTGYTQTYRDDFNASFNGTSLQGNDSIAVNKIASLVGSNHGNFHDVCNYWGVYLKLPYRYAPIIKFYTGSNSAEYKTGADRIYLKPFVPVDKKYDHDYYSIGRKMNFGVELFLFNGYNRVSQYKSLPLAARKNLRFVNNILALSVYVEKMNAANSYFGYSDGAYDISVGFDKVMNQSFRDKYKTDYNIGFRISYGVF